MVLMPVSLLRDDMILAKDVETNSANAAYFPLIRVGVRLNDTMIAKLKAHEIDAVYVERKGTEDIVATEALPTALKNEALNRIEVLFSEGGKSGRSFSYQMFRDADRISEKLVESALSDPETLVSLMSLKRHDDYTYTHSLCVALLSIAVGMSMEYNYLMLKDLSTAALLHDIGKTEIPNEVLNKPTKLSAEEFILIQTHAEKGADMVDHKSAHVAARISAGIRNHHERYDGTGYPDGLKRDEIPDFAKIIAVADVYDALTSDRSYRKAGKPYEAIEYIMGCANTHFDIEILNHFLKKTVAYPVGSIVCLSDGREAIVVKNHPENIMRPRVRVVDQAGEPTEELDLLYSPECYSITIKDVL